MKIKKANSCLMALLKVVFRPVLRSKYKFKFERKTSKGIKRPCFILANHQTAFDQFAVGVGFRFGINFVGSDSLFRHGFGSKMMKLLARPIPISKGSSDPTAVKNIMSVIRDGGAVSMFPSGNRSFFGEESTINPAVAKLAKKLRVPLVLVKMRGGFFAKARWMAEPSKGKVRSSVVRVLQPEELAALSDAEVFEIIQKTLYFDEFEWNRKEQIVFKGNRKAEHLETVLFWCPQCNSFHDLKSQGNEFFCGRCGMRVRINGMYFFEKVNNADAVPETILDWGRAQLDYIKNFDYSAFTDKPVFSDENVSLFKVERAKDQELLAKGQIALYADRLSVCGTDFPLDKIREMAVQGVLRLGIYTDDCTYCVDIPQRGNLFKYMICGYKLINAATNSQEEYYGY